jgi:hypothetical protein
MIFQKHDSNDDLAYWISNSSTLLIMVQKSLKAVGSSGTSPQKRPQTQTSILGRTVCFVPFFQDRACARFVLSSETSITSRSLPRPKGNKE